MIWISSAVYKILGWFMKEEDLEILKFFIPLILQIKAFAIQTGQGSIRMGLVLLKDAALKAVEEAAKAEGGDRVKIAEKAFVRELKETGVEAVNNAAAGLLKAAVAGIQTGIINAELAKISQTPDVKPTIPTTN